MLQFLGVGAEEFFCEQCATGKITVRMNHVPSFDLEERRQAWLEVLRDNPGLNRNELKLIGKGLYTWIFKHARDWYEQVTPRVQTRKKRTPVIDWGKRDEDCLVLAKQAVESITSRDGKPIRVMPSTIRREIGAGVWFKNKKLVQTWQFIDQVTEDINTYRIRKIKWAIGELENMGVNVTAYKVQLYAGFGGNNKEITTLIASVLYSSSHAISYRCTASTIGEDGVEENVNNCSVSGLSQHPKN